MKKSELRSALISFSGSLGVNAILWIPTGIKTNQISKQLDEIKCENY